MNENANIDHLSVPKKPRNVCVYCGSGWGNSPVYSLAAQQFGEILAKSGIGLVYGGGGLGLMGIIARSALKHGGQVTGVIPQFLSQHEQMLQDVSELILTGDMHERKRLMCDRSDAFVALPGGVGTLEELVEQLTWSQLGRHRKPVIVANINKFWQPFLELLDHLRKDGFIRPDLDLYCVVVDQINQVIPEIEKSLDKLRKNKPKKLNGIT